MICHLPHGRCGSKQTVSSATPLDEGHLPHGRCGSKPTASATGAEKTSVTCLTAGVDRNSSGTMRHSSSKESPASRQVWIETMLNPKKSSIAEGHLPHGRCGSKPQNAAHRIMRLGSPASRQVWIETKRAIAVPQSRSCHLPHGRCGSKQRRARRYLGGLRHLPHGRCGSKLAMRDGGRGDPSHLPHGRCGSKPRPARAHGQRARHLPHGRCGSKQPAAT
ncbi:NAD+-dependent alcohol dehydrogenase [Bifidobacterium eulemuris]|uniref:NAD+-dependent alcohol dehydrogenase n=1 Tax=Bifidobacterium eulemuris TaxID=1765219 RepID=A0A261FY25_9BIFI|nr:NAD+-dependent alcohol dehydrogenase [Bifidobacterium eulemuris]